MINGFGFGGQNAVAVFRRFAQPAVAALAAGLATTPYPRTVHASFMTRTQLPASVCSSDIDETHGGWR